MQHSQEQNSRGARQYIYCAAGNIEANEANAVTHFRQPRWKPLDYSCLRHVVDANEQLPQY